MNAQQPMVVVLGANGRLGRSLVNAFAAANWRVRAQMRDQNRWRDGIWPEDIEPWFCDAHDGAALCRSVEGADVVVNALNPLYTQWKHQALLLATNALAAARSSGATLLFPGSLYNFGSHLPERLHEDTPQVGNTPKGKMRIAMEAALRGAAADGVNSIVLRAGDYFGGPGHGAWFDQVIARDLAKGRMTYPGPIDRVHTWAYLPDFAATFVRVAAQHTELRGFHAYHFPGYAITGAELHTALERVAGRRLRLTGMPWWGLRLVAPFSPMMRAILEMRYLWNRPHRLEDGPLSELIGELPSTPLNEALRSALAALGIQGLRDA